MAAGYTKLFSTIVRSTIWREPNHVRLLWVTMLAITDRDGVVESSVPGLADTARITLDECVDALNRLQSPDQWSRTQEHEGRRIVECEGGWRLLNYEKYRTRASREDALEANRVRVARHRAKAKAKKQAVSAPGNGESKAVTPVMRSAKSNAIAEAEAEADPDLLEDEDPRLTGSARGESICPTHLRLPEQSVKELSSKLGCPASAIREVERRFVGYWTLGGGAGKRRSNWMGKLRQEVVQAHERGLLTRGNGRGRPVSAAEANKKLLDQMMAEAEREEGGT